MRIEENAPLDKRESPQFGGLHSTEPNQQIIETREEHASSSFFVDAKNSISQVE